MKLPFIFIGTALFILGASISGCSTMSPADNAAAATNCKVALAQPGRINADSSKQTSLEKSQARATLANSPYRMALLNTPQALFNYSVSMTVAQCFLNRAVCTLRRIE